MSCVLTLALDDDAQQRFEDLRQQWFPPELNRIPAHLSLFHTLPENEATTASLLRIASEMQVFPMRVAEVRSIGRGVAFFLESPEASRVHRRLSEAFAEDLTAQDRQGFRPHVVAQNKAAPQAARETLAILQAGFAPWVCEAVGLDLWRYLGGPWKHLQRFAFQRFVSACDKDSPSSIEWSRP